jgi:hypothetical protein
MLDDTGYGPSLRRRGSGDVLTHTVMATLGVPVTPAFDRSGLSIALATEVRVCHLTR